MPINIKAICVLLINIGCFTQSRTHTPFVHIGLLNTSTELTSMQKKIMSDEEPWKSAFNNIKDYRNLVPKPVSHYRDGAGHTNDAYDENMQKLVSDAEAAYGSSLKWFVTHDTTYARKTVEILNAWSKTLKHIDTRDDGALSTSYGWPSMIYAAEIMRYTYKEWSSADQKRFANLLRQQVLPATQKAVDKDNGNNWRSFGLFCRLAIAVYLNDHILFNVQIDSLRKQISHYIYEDGQNLETPRDLWHAQMGMAPLVASAEIAWHQGVDLYSYANNRLLRGVEWHIPFLLGDTTGWPKVFTSTEKKYKGYKLSGKAVELWPFYELVYNHYHNRKGIETPNTLLLLSTVGRPEGPARTGGWGTATHYRHDLIEGVLKL